ncbi:hypothetical protein KL936_005436 [Ogataea polymorpha]|nr:hypothetical protein KL936_005436 [Ogataea polymorpha]
MSTEEQVLLQLQQVMSPDANFLMTNPFPKVLMLKSSNNYLEWKRKFEEYIRVAGEDIYTFYQTGQVIVHGEICHNPSLIAAHDKVLKFLIINTIEPDILKSLKFEDNGRTYSEIIRNTYGNIGLYEIYMRMKHTTKSLDSLREKSNKFRELCLDLESITTDSETHHVLSTLHHLNDEDLENRIFKYKPERITFLDLNRAIEEKEFDHQSSVYSANFRPPQSGFKTYNRKKIICARCKEEGHKSFRCRAPNSVLESNNAMGVFAKTDKFSMSAELITTAPEIQEALHASNNSDEGNVFEEDAYWFDSGASVHISNNKSHFKNLKDYKGYIQGLNGGCLVEGIGQVTLYHGNKKLCLEKVYYVPLAKKNLIALSFAAKKATVTLKREGLFINGELYGSLLPNMLFKSIYVPSYLGEANLASQINYHSHYGHPSIGTAKKMNLPVTSEICEACMLGKSTKTIPKTNTTKVKYPLELLQADVCGPFPNLGLKGERYFLTIVDRFSHMTKVFTLQQKSEVPSILENYISQLDTEFYHRKFRVLRLRTDNGTEFCNNQLNQFLRNKGIHHELTESYASYQNGVAERMHRTLIERTRVLLSSSGCPERFWPYALLMANYLINREPSAAISFKIPYQLWYNKLPDYSRYHPFGCRAYYMIPNVRRQSKFSDVSSLAVFLGHSESRKSYILYDCVQKSFIETSQVKFNEWDFPFLHGSKKSSIPMFDTIPGRPLTMRPQFYTHVTSSSEPQHTFSPSVQSGPLDSHMPDSIITPSSTSSSSHHSSVVSDTPDPSIEDLEECTVDSILEPSDSSFSYSTNSYQPTVSTQSTDIQNSSSSIPEVSSVESSPSHSSTNSYSPIVLASPSPPNSQCDSLNPVIPQIRPWDPLDSDTEPDPPRYPCRRLNNNALMAFTALPSSKDSVPKSVSEAMTSPAWRQAMLDELHAHKVNGTWSLVQLPPGRRALGCRWVFVEKQSPKTHKARLVVQGFRQIYGLDYTETFSPVIRYESVRVLLAIAAQLQLQIHQMDVTTAFLNGDLDEEIYMNQPPGFVQPGSEQKVCRLHRSLYGLKQAPLCWNFKINAVLSRSGFTRVPSEFGIYVSHEEPRIYVGLYVDDLLILSSSPSKIQTTKDLLSSQFTMKDLGPVQHFLGLDINCHLHSVSLSLHTYIDQLLSQYGMSSCNSVRTPCDTASWDIPNDPVLSNPTEYRSMVGKLLFAANTVRMDISYVVSKLSRYLKEPKKSHMAKAKHVLKYLKGTSTYGITYSKDPQLFLRGYCDADWGGNVDRSSTTGYVFVLANAPITWRSKKQATVALSSTEAEYMALGDAVKELLWLKQLLYQLKVRCLKLPTIYCDNTSALALSDHPAYHPRTKHIDIRYHFIRSHIQDKALVTSHVPSSFNIADSLTKALNREKFESLRTKQNLKII